MDWLYFAILSYFLFAVVFILDKVLIKKVISPLNYVLIVGGLQGFVFFLIPFVDFKIFNNFIIVVAFLSGAFLILGLYFYYKILSKYEATWVIPLLFGVFVPITSLISGRFLLGEKLNFFQTIAFILLILSGVIISFGRRYDIASILLIMFSGLFMGFYFTLLKFVFNFTNFWSSYILAGIGGFLTTVVIFSIVYGRRLFREKLIKEIKKKDFFEIILSAGGGLFVLKQALSFVANFILLYSISIGNLILVNGLGGMRYIFLFILAILFIGKWSKIIDEQLSFKIVVKKMIAIFLITLAVIILMIKPVITPGAKIWGVDFSDLYAKQLGLDSRKVLMEIINDLKVKNFRLDAHWSEIEKAEGQYDFSELDFQVNEIEKSGGKIILAVGKRLPRWPECHIPSWAREFSISNSQFSKNKINNSLLKYIEVVINRYKNNKAIWAWQIENEPFLWGFGECPIVDDEFLEKEIAIVKESSGGRPILLTDSGEFGLWFRTYKRADIFGTTMYRVVLSKIWPFGYLKYPLGPDFFKTKVGIMENLFGKKEIINIELQAEPWLKKRPPDILIKDQLKAFSLDQFKENIEYARQVGFEKNYLWGAEWWYWMKQKQGHREFWEEAKKLFSN